MKIHLICSEGIQNIVEELLKNREIHLDASSEYAVVEKGHDIPHGKVGVVFDMQTLGVLMTFFDNLEGHDEDATSVITGRYKDAYEIIRFEQIQYFEGSGNDVFCIADNGGRYKVKEKLYELEGKLRSQGFIRISKPHLVNISKVGQIIPWFNGKLLLKMEETQEELDVTRRYVKDFKGFLGI